MSERTFEVGPDRPRPEAARRLAGVSATPPVEDDDDAIPVVARTVSLTAVRDAVGGALLISGMAIGDTAAFMAGGKIPGLATLGGCLIAAGVILAYR